PGVVAEQLLEAHRDVEPAQAQLLESHPHAAHPGRGEIPGRAAAMEIPRNGRLRKDDEAHALQHRDGDGHADVERTRVQSWRNVGRVADPQLESDRGARVVIAQRPRDRGPAGEEVESPARLEHEVVVALTDLTRRALVPDRGAERGAATPLQVDAARDGVEVGAAAAEV